MKPEQIRILKTMSQATNRMDINMFAQMVNLNPNQIMAEIQELASAGFLRKVGNGYGVTEKGKAALKTKTPVPKDMEFHFYVQIGQPLGLTAQTPEEFYKIVEQVSIDSLEFHLYRGDFENWIKDAVGDPELAQEIGNVKNAGVKGEELRKELLKTIETKYGIQELL